MESTDTVVVTTDQEASSIWPDWLDPVVVFFSLVVAVTVGLIAWYITNDVRQQEVLRQPYVQSDGTYRAPVLAKEWYPDHRYLKTPLGSVEVSREYFDKEKAGSSIHFEELEHSGTLPWLPD